MDTRSGSGMTSLDGMNIGLGLLFIVLRAKRCQVFQTLTGFRGN